MLLFPLYEASRLTVFTRSTDANRSNQYYGCVRSIEYSSLSRESLPHYISCIEKHGSHYMLKKSVFQVKELSISTYSLKFYFSNRYRCGYIYIYIYKYNCLSIIILFSGLTQVDISDVEG